ncbi:MAG: glycosyltransferase, partial [Nitrospirae bacterium]|nr:glycosyltransferase [Nitrospirota bacterium]
MQVTILVVDNASTDGSVEVIERKYPKVNLIRNTKNSGFTGGNNKAIKVALDMGA